MSRTLSVLNLISVIVAAGVSFLAQNLAVNGNTISSLSARYDTLFTPAGYAFAIWGVIFLGLLAYGIFLVRAVYKETRDVWIVEKTGPWFLLANLANASWVFAWLFEFTGLSVLLMLVILFSLIMVILKTNMERWDAPLKIIAFTWWPICLYSGWITVATIANISAFLVKIGWDGWFFNQVQWAMLMIVIATAINIAMVYTRNMREFAAVGIWALVAIYFRQFDGQPVVSYTALIGAVAILSNVSYHGWMNRKTNPIYRLLNKEKG